MFPAPAGVHVEILTGDSPGHGPLKQQREREREHRTGFVGSSESPIKTSEIKARLSSRATAVFACRDCGRRSATSLSVGVTKEEPNN